MSLNNIHYLKPQNLKEVTVFGRDCLGNRVPVDSYWVSADEFTSSHDDVSADQKLAKAVAEITREITAHILGVEPEYSFSPDNCIDVIPIDRKRQTGGIISARNFPHANH